MKYTQEKALAFCAVLSETCRVDKACAAIGLTRAAVYRWREKYPKFAEAWDAAKRIGVTALEDEAHRRAFDGTDKPVFHQGMECGTVREYSDTLAIFLLKSHDPEKYRDRVSQEHTGPNGGPIQLDDQARADKVRALLAGAAARKDADGGS